MSHDQSKHDETSFEYTIALLGSSPVGSDCGGHSDLSEGQDDAEVKVMTRLVKHTGYCSPSDVSVAAMMDDLFCLVVPERFVRKSALKNKQDKFRFELKIDKSRNMIA